MSGNDTEQSDSLINWECPSCGTTFIGVEAKEAFEHLLQCGKPEPDYRGYVYLGVKGKYRSEVKRLERQLNSDNGQSEEADHNA